MVSVNNDVPMDLNLDLTAYVNKFLDDEDIVDNPLNQLNIESPYMNLKELSTKYQSSQHKFEYTALHLNIQSLPAKFDKLKLLVYELHNTNIDLDFILICETFLSDSNANQFNIPGYNLVYRNRPNAQRGGVAIFIKSKHNFIERDDLEVFEPGIFESVFVEIKSDNLNAIVGEIYRIPNTNENATIHMYEHIITKLQDYRKHIIIGTDQNMDYIKLEQHRNTEDLLGTFLTNGLIPTITKPTRITHTSATLIDNIYINVANSSKIESAILMQDISDHLPILTCFGCRNFKPKIMPNVFHKRLINDDAKEQMGKKLTEINWTYLENMNVNQAYNEFSNKLNNIVEAIAPLQTITIPASHVIRDPWMTSGLINSSRTMNELHKKKLCKDKNHPYYHEYIRYRNYFNKLKQTAKQSYYDNILKRYQYDIRKTWGVINSLIGRSNNKSGINESFKHNDQNITDPNKIANEFCIFFYKYRKTICR